MTDDANSITIKATRGAFWVGAGQVIKQVVGFVTYVVLAKLLEPDDFGVMGMTMVFVGYSLILAEHGLGAAIVQAKVLDNDTISSAFWLNSTAFALFALILIVASPFIADFYASEKVEDVVMALSATVVLVGVMAIPKALLYRAMEFGYLVKSEVIGSVVAAISVLILATYGMGVWSLVFQQLIGSAVTLLVVLHYSSWTPKLTFSWSSLRGIIKYSGNALGVNTLAYINQKSDNLIIGKVLGANALGYYAITYQIMLFPLQQISSIIVRVMFPALSKVQDDLPRFRKLYLKSVGAISLLTFPMMFGLFSVAEDFILVVLSEKWLPILPLLQVFCFVGMVQSVVTTVGLIYLSTGKLNIMLYMSLLTTPVLVLTFLVSAQWGIEAVAESYAVVSFCIANISVFVAFRLIKLEFYRFYAELYRQFFAALFMCLTVLLFDAYLTNRFISSAELSLALNILIGVMAYCLFALALCRQQFIELLVHLKRTFVK